MNKFKTEEGVNIISLFDGMSCLQIALNELNVKVNNYFASEIDTPAMNVTMDNFPNTKQLGDICKLSTKDMVYSQVDSIDLVAGGSPCQTVSLANKGGGSINDGKSKLFWEYVRVLKEVQVVNPDVKFILENVPMNKASKDTITEIMGVEPIMINSNAVSFQNRKRLWWTNIEGVTQPKDLNILLKDNYCEEYDESLVLKGKGLNKLDRPRNRAISILSDKCGTLMKSQEKKPTDSLVFDLGNNIYRYPTRTECELMQNVPIGFTKVANYRLATGMLGNGWTVGVAKHILNNLI